MRIRSFLVVCSALLASCSPAGSQSPAATSTTSSKAGEPASLTGRQVPQPLKEWDEFRFGMTFDEALNAAKGVQWQGSDFQACREEIPIQGCWLAADPERTYRVAIAGMELMPRLEFNQKGQLTDVYMGRKYSSPEITSAICEDMHVRLLDALAEKYGAPEKQKKGEANIKHTPAGHDYGRSASDNRVMVAGLNEFRTATDGSNIALLTTYVAGSEYSEPNCSIGFFVDGPKSYTRRPTKSLAEISAELDAPDK